MIRPHGLSNLDRMHGALAAAPSRSGPGSPSGSTSTASSGPLHLSLGGAGGRPRPVPGAGAAAGRLVTPDAWRTGPRVRRGSVPAGDPPRAGAANGSVWVVNGTSASTSLGGPRHPPGPTRAFAVPGDPLARMLRTASGSLPGRGEERTADRGSLRHRHRVRLREHSPHRARPRGARVPGISLLRYADDLLILARSEDAARRAGDAIDRVGRPPAGRPASHGWRSACGSRAWRGRSRGGRTAGGPFPRRQVPPPRAGVPRRRLRRTVADKFRKLCNLFRYAFRRKAKAIARSRAPRRGPARHHPGQGVLEGAVRNVAMSTTTSTRDRRAAARAAGPLAGGRSPGARDRRGPLQGEFPDGPVRAAARGWACRRWCTGGG